MDDKLSKAINLYEEYKLDEANKLFEDIIDKNPQNIEALLYLGKINSKTQNYGKSMNYYNNVLSLDKENYDAKIGLTLIKNILSLTNTFYFENAYTDDELYEFD